MFSSASVRFSTTLTGWPVTGSIQNVFVSVTYSGSVTSGRPGYPASWPGSVSVPNCLLTMCSTYL